MMRGVGRIEYDLPSSLFGQFKDERVNWVVVWLEGKLADLTAEATRGGT